jgi:DNA-binding NtrC family response regulator
LLYRINTVTVEVPPLRERSDDIPLLIEHFISKMVREENIKVSPEAMGLLCEYHWPGNVRELKNVIERALVLACDGRVTTECLPVEILNRKKMAGLPVQTERPLSSALKSLADLEKEQILATLTKVNWHRGRAAHLLGITPKTLYRKLRSYDLQTK